jgi:hypothetical protein
MRKCIIYTVKNDSAHLKNLTQSLGCVLNNLIPFSPEVEFLFFCDPGVENLVRNIVSSVNIKNDVFYFPFTTRPPAGYEKTSQLQYKNMCRFWAGEVFRHPKVLGYDYYMRLDCDSFITGPIGYDPFDMMQKENKDYAFITKFMDTPPYFEGLNKALAEFEAQFPEKMKNPVSTLQEGLLYYTNFEICRVKAFSEGLYKGFFDHIERIGGIYKHRWGDHIIRYAGIHMLIGFDRVKEMNIKYTHQAFTNG